MLNPGRSGNNAASQPEYDAQTEAPPVGSYCEFISAVSDPLAAFAIAVQNATNFPQCRLGLKRSESQSSATYRSRVWRTTWHYADASGSWRLPPLGDIHNDTLPFGQASKPGSFESRGVEIDVCAIVVSNDEAVTRLRIERFYSARLFDARPSRSHLLDTLRSRNGAAVLNTQHLDDL